MIKIAITLSLLISLLIGDYPKDVTGKWIVDHIEVGDMGNIPPQQKEKMIAITKSWFKNASFILQPNHKCVLSVNMPSMPKINYWRYDATKGIITLSVNAQDKSRIMVIEVSERNDNTFFSVKETEVTLKVHKVS